ncbi:hypothetical protein VB776_10830 [Arcicella sp. DC2W]|uniref:Uncharacterized protein n=1 Tax=Arcicella gelida TaxID=2984195 RepID=A0ABU5S598_9BACT|nr:hypothetical protein [Arcicella sp. DC2W]MEA5403413.1 hypothetical protein [Arcicella sp. DC2W]
MSRFLGIIIFFFTIQSSVGQTIVCPTEIPFYIIQRKSPYITLPDSLGGKDVKGFAGFKITLYSGKLKQITMLKLKLSGKVNISYSEGNDLKDSIINKYEVFLKRCVHDVEIVKTDKRKAPKIYNIMFLSRF